MARVKFIHFVITDNGRKKANIAWRDALRHSTENVEDQRAEEIQVERK